MKYNAPSPLTWRKSSKSGDNAGNCVEIATTTSDVAIRDTKNRSGGILTIDKNEWAGLLRVLKD